MLNHQGRKLEYYKRNAHFQTAVVEYWLGIITMATFVNSSAVCGKAAEGVGAHCRKATLSQGRRHAPAPVRRLGVCRATEASSESSLPIELKDAIAASGASPKLSMVSLGCPKNTVDGKHSTHNGATCSRYITSCALRVPHPVLIYPLMGHHICGTMYVAPYLSPYMWHHNGST